MNKEEKKRRKGKGNGAKNRKKKWSLKQLSLNGKRKMEEGKGGKEVERGENGGRRFCKARRPWGRSLACQTASRGQHGACEQHFAVLTESVISREAREDSARDWRRENEKEGKEEEKKECF